MTAHRPASAALVALASTAAVLLAGCTGSGPNGLDPAPDADPSPPLEGRTGGVLTNYTWRSGPYDGDIAVGFSLQAQGAAECSFSAAAMGESQGQPPTMALVVDGGVDAPAYLLSRGQGALATGAHARAEVAGAAELGVPATPYAWADEVRRPFALVPGVPVNVTFAVDGAKFMDEASRPGWTPEALGESSVVFQATCEGGVAVLQAFQGSNVLLFNEASFAGGANAHAGVAIEETGLAAASRVGLDVTDPFGVLLVSLRGDLLLNHVGAGVVEAEYPGGSELLVDRPSQLLVEYAVLGNPLGVKANHVYRSTAGAYAVGATYASLEWLGLLEGAILGLQPVDAWLPPE